MLPQWLRTKYVSYDIHPVQIGRSEARVFGLTHAVMPALYAKVSSGEGRSDLLREAERLTWLSGKFPVPMLVEITDFQDEAALVMSAMPGESLIAANTAAASERAKYATLLGTALRQFHSIDITGCPFLHASAGGPAHPDGLTDSIKMQMYLDLLERFPAWSRRVLLHGDPSLPNILTHDFALSGLIDLGAVGVGDALRDVALALWSLEYNYGPGFAEDLLQGYEVNLHHPILVF